MSKPHVWVVEIKDEGQWKPGSSVSVHNWDALHYLGQWRRQCPNNQFRVAKYVRVEPTAKRRKSK